MGVSTSSKGWKADVFNDEDVVYLNNAGEALLSSAVQTAGFDAIQTQRSLPQLVQDQNQIRSFFATLIDADSSDIAITPSTAFAITMAARNLQRTVLQGKKNGSILVLHDQFNSAIYPWQQICEESNGQLSLAIVPNPSTRGWTDAILERLDETVHIACLPPIFWSTGSLIDLEKIGVACRKLNIPLVVDATQGVGIMELSIQKIRPVFLACSVHKWLRGPAGTSLVYVSKSVQKDWMPLDFHGRSRDTADGKNFDPSRSEMGPHGYPENFFDDARKFDSGGKPNPILLPMLRSSLEQVVKIDVVEAQEKLNNLMEPLITWALSRGYEIPGEPRAYHIVGIRPSDQTVDEMLATLKKLKSKGISIAVRCGCYRVSPYLDTSAGDIQRLISALDEIINGKK